MIWIILLIFVKINFDEICLKSFFYFLNILIKRKCLSEKSKLTLLNEGSQNLGISRSKSIIDLITTTLNGSIIAKIFHRTLNFLHNKNKSKIKNHDRTEQFHKKFRNSYIVE